MNTLTGETNAIKSTSEKGGASMPLAEKIFHAETLAVGKTFLQPLSISNSYQN